MMMPDAVYDHSVPKKAQNISINADLSRQLKAEKVNLSAECEKHLTEVLRNIKRQKWQEENRDALEYYDTFVEEYGSFGESNRRF